MSEEQRADRRAQPLWVRLALVALCTGALAVTLLAGVYRQVHEDFGDAEFRQEGEALVRVAVAGAMEPVITEDRAELDTIVEVLARSSRAISRIRIRNEREELLAGWTRDEHIAQPGGMVFSRAVALAGERFGSVELTLDSSFHDLAFRRNLVELSAFMASGIFAVVAVLLLFVHLQVVRPIQRMESRLQSEGSFRRRRPPAFRGQPREIAMLQQAVCASVMHARASARRHAELQSAHAQATAASQAKARFLANMSHELRTPLAAVTGALRVIRDDAGDPDHARRLAGEAERAAVAMRDLIDDMLDFADGDHAGMETPVDFDLPACLESVRALFAPEGDSRGLRLLTALDPQCARHVQGPLSRIRQLLIILVGNAIKFTPSGLVRIAVHPAGATQDGGQRLRFSVTDTGPGIAPGDQPGLFEEFRQVREDYARTHGGVGLGLALARRIVTRAGGRIGVDSMPGQGSTFWFELDLRPAAPDATAANGPGVGERPAGDTLHGMRVLVVDDSDANRLVAAAILGGLGCSVTECASGPDAVRAAGGSHFDVILMDLQMPEMDGFDACRRIRAETDSSAVILALSANSSPRDREAARAAGMAGLIAKPAGRAELLQGLQSYAGTGRGSAGVQR